jgi:peptidoglycan lytic transglycosylase
MKSYAVLFVPALIGYLVVASLCVTYAFAQTSLASAAGQQSSESIQETPTEDAVSETTSNTSPPVLPVQYGVASWYGRAFHGRPTASGEPFDMAQITAAHRSAPLGTQALVTNLDNGQAVRVRINDRGPWKRGRLLDLSYGAAQRIGMLQAGSARVKVEFLPETKTAERSPREGELSREAERAGSGHDEPVATALPATFFEPDAAQRERQRTVYGQTAQARVGSVRWFAVQAGTFGDLNDAVQLQKALMAYHPTVWINSMDDGSQLLHRVRIGPFANRDEAERVARYMAGQGFGLGMIVLQ